MLKIPTQGYSIASAVEQTHDVSNIAPPTVGRSQAKRKIDRSACPALRNQSCYKTRSSMCILGSISIFQTCLWIRNSLVDYRCEDIQAYHPLPGQSLVANRSPCNQWYCLLAFTSDVLQRVVQLKKLSLLLHSYSGLCGNSICLSYILV